MRVKVEFSGGLEILFGGSKDNNIELPDKKDDGLPVDIKYLIKWLKLNLLVEREEFFVDNDGESM